MTDTRLPSRWLLDPDKENLSDRAWRTFTGSLMWSNEAGTDGKLPRKSIRFFHPDGVDSATLAELLDAGIWEEAGQDLQIPDWERNGQELHETVESRRAGNRERQRALRAKGEKKKVRVTGDVTRDVTDIEEDRKGQERQERHVHDGDEARVNSWPTAVPGVPYVTPPNPKLLPRRVS